MVKEYIEMLFARGYVEAVLNVNGEISYKYNGVIFTNIEALGYYISNTTLDENISPYI
jgi:hypothetical protein